jgi:CAAX prenyl protease-like protein
MTEHEEQRFAGAAPAALAANVPPSRRAAAARILPFAAYIFFTIAGDLAERLGVSAADLRWLYPIKIGAVALLLALSWREYTELRDTGPGPIDTPVAIAAGVAVLGLWVSLDAGWMIVGSSPGFDPRNGGNIDWTLALVRIAGAALVVPVMEELFWRSFLMRWIEAADFQAVDPSQVRLKSFVITVVLFGFEHNLWLAGVVAGVAYSALYLRYRTLWSPVLAHAVTNCLLGIWVVATGNWSYW